MAAQPGQCSGAGVGDHDVQGEATVPSSSHPLLDVFGGVRPYSARPVPLELGGALPLPEAQE
eukprot:6508595-Heterocapsa_arctica.AAC.2